MGMESVIVDMRKKAAEAEINSEKANLLALIDGVIKCETDKLLSGIDRLKSIKKQICDLKQLRSEVESERIGEGAKAVVERTLSSLW
jgi:hypothetical protein